MSDYKGFLELRLTDKQLTVLHKYLKKKLTKNYGRINFALISQPSTVSHKISVKLFDDNNILYELECIWE